VTPGFSVVIPTYQRRDSLRMVLDGLAAQEYPWESLEVLVVSDGGRDGTVEMVRGLAFPFGLRVLEQDNRGPAAARNLGLLQARGPFVLFLDDDVVPVPTLVAEHAAAHGERSDQVVIGPMLGHGRERAPWVHWEAARLGEQYDAMDAGAWSATPWQLYTGNASVLRDHVVAAGGFDASLKRAEDIELGFRLQRRGLEFRFHRAAAGVHFADRSYSSWLRSARQYGQNDVQFGKVEERVVRELEGRHPYTRRLIRWGLAHPRMRGPVDAAAGLVAVAAYRLGAARLSGQVCSAVFNLNYWMGVEAALGAEEAARLAAEPEPPAAAGRVSREGTSLPIGPPRWRP
jgi:glycosyltransferase involved in cell wall biosynthesis